MFIEHPEKLTIDSFQERDIYDELLEIESELDQSLAAGKLRAAAKELGCAGSFDKNYNMAKKEFAKYQKRELSNSSELFGACLTDFSLRDQNGGQFQCGDWIADDEGIRIQTDRGLQWACTHVIYISKILRSVDTGKYKAEIVFQIPGRKVQTICVDRKTLASANKILDIADYGVIVTSINAPLLVKYLADLQTLNPDLIEECPSTNRLGWVDGIDADGKPIKQFLPYQSKVVFDNTEMMHLFKAIEPHGSCDTWYKLARDIRAKRQPEVLINLAASFASVLVEPCGALPFIVSLWGETGIGKTVILKFCTSVWADPKEGKYITDPKATRNALELRLNILNSFPMVIDDMAQITMQSDEDFSQRIYDWCSGIGKDRGTKEGGLRALTHWKNCTITNGERSLVDESMQGGAINRVIDIEASGDKLFDAKSGQRTVDVVNKNYGWAGEEFIRQIVYLGFEELNRIYNEQYERVREAARNKGVEKEDKQVVPMAILLAADFIAEKFLFTDGVTIDIDQAIDYLRNKGEISENKRTYEYLLNVIAENRFRFEDDNADHTNLWGYWKPEDESVVVINGSRFDAIVKEGGFQSKSFLQWAKRQGIVETDANGNPKKVVSHAGHKFRAVVMKTTYGYDADAEEIAEIQEKLPFK